MSGKDKMLEIATYTKIEPIRKSLLKLEVLNDDDGHLNILLH